MSPADLNNPMIDELSVMTYISYYFGPANERLMKWLQEKLPEKKITNFTTDWNDGTNLAILMNRIYPDLAADHAEYKKENPVVSHFYLATHFVVWNVIIVISIIYLFIGQL